MVRVVVGVLLLFLACVQATTRVCDTTPETIYDLEVSTYEQRLLCEGSQFRDASCSSFWMRQGKLLRAKLSLKLCEEFQAAPYFKYAGTPNLPEGVFFHEQVAASTITNATGQYLRDAILAEHLALRANVSSLWGDLREYMTALVDLQWADTRTNGTQEQENTRALVYSDYGKGTRDDVIASATADRAEVDAKNEDARSHDTDEESTTRSFVESQHDETRAYDTQEESTTRALVDSRNEEIRSLFDAESTNTKDTVSSADISDTNAFEANVEAEESTTRALVASTTATTQNLVNSEENTTRTVISAAVASEETATIEAAAQDAAQTQSHVDTEAATDRADVAAAKVEVSNTWASLVTFVSSLADGWLYSLQNNEEATIINLLLHLNLQTGTWNIFEGDNIMNQFTSIDLFSRSDYILKLRAVANDTITYNRNAYGSDSQANNAWTTAEQKRASGNYVDAAYYYGIAYKYAVTP